MPTATVGISVTGLGAPLSASKTITASGAKIITETIPPSSTNLPIPGFSADVSEMEMLAILATGADLVVKTNNAVTPTDTLNLANGIPLVYSGEPFETNPLTADVTDGLFVTNANPTDPATLDIRSLEDATP